MMLRWVRCRVFRKSRRDANASGNWFLKVGEQTQQLANLSVDTIERMQQRLLDEEEALVPRFATPATYLFETFG